MAGRRSRKEPRIRITAPSGQRLSIVDRGTRGWQLEATLPERGRIRESLGSGSRDEATRKALARIADYERAALAVDAPTFVRVGAELIVAKQKAGHSPAYLSAIEGHLRNYILPHYGEDRRLSTIGPAEHTRFKHLLGDGDLDLKTCNRILTTLRQLFKHAQEKHYCVEHVFPKNFREDPSVIAERWQLLEPQDVGTLLAHAPDELRPLLGYLANTGLRIGTALKTEDAWIDSQNQVVYYPASAMKGRRPHTVELNDSALAFLREAIELRPAGGTKPFPFSYWFVTKRWPTLRGEAGFPNLRIHDLRHSFVSAQLAAGTPIHVVKAMAAHRSLAVTDLYAHHTNEARMAAAARVEIRPFEQRARNRGEEPDPIDTRFDTKPPSGGQNSNLKRQKPRKNAALLVGHLGLEPRANGLRIHCSTN